MSGEEPVFRWDAYGISAYDATWTTANGISTISGVNSKKFVRFDKNGIYGINNAPGIDGQSWHPTGVGYDNNPNKEIDANATFALTWEGLKVVSNDGATLRIGNSAVGGKAGAGTILRVSDSQGNTTFQIKANGSVEMGNSSGFVTEEGLKTSLSNYVPMDSDGGFAWSFDPSSGVTMGESGNYVL